MLIYKKSKLITILLFSIVIFQNPPWMFWGVSYFLVVACVLCLGVLCFSRVIREIFNYQNQIALFVVILLFFVFYSSIDQFRASSVITAAVFALLFFVRTDEKIAALDALSTILAFIIFISIIPWLINDYIYNLPSSSISYEAVKGGVTNIEELRNYYFFVSYIGGGVNRFYSIFDEPGVLGCLAAFVLFGNGYNFKDKRNLIIAVGGVFSFSLAFYLITVVGIIISNLNTGVKFFKSILFIFILVLFFIFAFSESDTFRYVIIDRILNLSDYGVASRTSNELNKFFEQFISSSSVFLGHGTAFFENNEDIKIGQSYKLFIIEYGLMGIVIVALMYFSLGASDLKIFIPCSIIFFISFLQRPFLFTPWQLVMFSLVFEGLRKVHSSRVDIKYQLEVRKKFS